MAAIDLAKQVGTTKGDLYVYNGTVLTRLAVGSDGQVLKAASGQATGLQWAAESGGGGGVSPLTDADTVVVTAARQSVSASSYFTIFDTTTGGDEILSGSIYGVLPGMRLTIDGTVVINQTASINGDNSAGANFGVINVPWAIADTSMKLEAYNASGAARNMGWTIFRR